MIDCLLGCYDSYIEDGYNISEPALDYSQDGVFDIYDIAIMIDHLLGH